MLERFFAITVLSTAAACGGGNEAPPEGAEENDAPAEEASIGEATPTPAATGPFGQVNEGVLFNVTTDGDTGEFIVSLPAPDGDGVALRMIHAAAVTAGLGSNPVGLDRGASEPGRIIAFRRAGKKLLIEQENWRYRASAQNPQEKRAVDNSFARSLLWAGDIKDDNGANGFTADISGFLTSDVLDLKAWLKDAGQGKFAVDAGRSFVDMSSPLTFPDNVEVDAVITIASDEPGSEVNATAAEGRAVTLTVHHSFVRLPDEGYNVRDYDPRAGAIDVQFYDFSSPLHEPIMTKVARRFRLERVDPNAESGPVKKPIIFYVDSGAPPQIRDALVEGASWWAEAFEDAGFEDGFQVKLLPEDAHPLDIRYNTISWTHRQTRGWSYGGGVVDPRTGEMISGRVILGSQRVRQDRMIFEGLAGADKTGTGAEDDPVELALDRIRQLSAHEVGHPLGFEHNFAASTTDRASVMDYPAPYVRPDGEGGLDLSGAYDSGIGEWDKFTVKWLYSQFPEGADEETELNKIIREGYASGLKFVADVEGRSVGTAHPDGSVWDNGADPVATLREVMDVRAIALNNFGLRNIMAGRDTSELRAVIVPIFLYHRYQVAAAAKLIGGYSFDYAVKGDGRAGGAPVSADRQREALAAVVASLDPAVMDLPDRTLNLLTPPVSSFASFKIGEYFDGDTGSMFDLLSAVDAAGAITIGALLHPNRAARLVELSRRDASALSFEDVLSAMEAQLFKSTNNRQRPIQQRLQSRYVSSLIELAGGAEAGAEARAAATGISFGGSAYASPAVRARVDAYLKALRNRIAPGLLDGATPARAHREWLIARIDRHLERAAPPMPVTSKKAAVPAGSPIGAAGYETCWHCDTTF
ncbi:MAG: DUF5117 domain-containing protein [Marinicaulis sp.]|nr:DUF5117 domain-containing protein [Marinicaulis sp.]